MNETKKVFILKSGLANPFTLESYKLYSQESGIKLYAYKRVTNSYKFNYTKVAMYGNSNYDVITPIDYGDNVIYFGHDYERFNLKDNREDPITIKLLEKYGKELFMYDLNFEIVEIQKDIKYNIIYSLEHCAEIITSTIHTFNEEIKTKKVFIFKNTHFYEDIFTIDAYKLYAQEAEIDLFFYDYVPHSPMYIKTCSSPKNNYMISTNDFGNIHVSYQEFENRKFNLMDNREDPITIKLLEKYGSKLFKNKSNFKIIEIPYDVEYDIIYDSGSESIHEKHRVWE